MINSAPVGWDESWDAEYPGGAGYPGESAQGADGQVLPPPSEVEGGGGGGEEVKGEGEEKGWVDKKKGARLEEDGG